MLKFTLQTMEYIYIHTTASDLKEMIPEDSVLEMTQTQPNTTFPDLGLAIRSSPTMTDTSARYVQNLSDRPDLRAARWTMGGWRALEEAAGVERGAWEGRGRARERQQGNLGGDEGDRAGNKGGGGGGRTDGRTAG